MNKMIVAERTCEMAASASDVFALITDNRSWQWRRDLRDVKIEGEDRFSEIDRGGHRTDFLIADKRAPLEYRLQFKNANMIGEFECEILALGLKSCRVKLVERVQIQKKLLALLAPLYLKRQQKKYLDFLSSELKRRAGQ